MIIGVRDCWSQSDVGASSTLATLGAASSPCEEDDSAPSFRLLAASPVEGGATCFTAGGAVNLAFEGEGRGGGMRYTGLQQVPKLV